MSWMDEEFREAGREYDQLPGSARPIVVLPWPRYRPCRCVNAQCAWLAPACPYVRYYAPPDYRWDTYDRTRVYNGGTGNG